MNDNRISDCRPEADETLMSFLRRAQVDAGYSEDGFIAIVSGAPMPDSRLAERRSFDWDSLSRFFNASADELFQLSERSAYYDKAAPNRSEMVCQKAPWVRSKGYAAHCPDCLRESPHWRKSWLQPDAIVCPEHGSILIRHCCGCGGDLAEMRWPNVLPVCPACGTHLTFSPVIQASPGMAARAMDLRQDIAEMFARRPVKWNDSLVSRAGVIWRAARVIDGSPQFNEFCSIFCVLLGLGNHDLQETPSGKSVRFAQSYLIAHLLAEMDPSLEQHYGFAARNILEFRSIDRSVLLKLTQLAESYQVEPTSLHAEGQLMMSFASCIGSNSIPAAA